MLIFIERVIIMKKTELISIIKEVIEESKAVKLNEEMSKASDSRDFFVANPNMTVKEIAAELGITINDVSSALSRYKTKLKTQTPVSKFTVGSQWESPAGKTYECTKITKDVMFMKDIATDKVIQVTEFQTKKWTPVEA